MKNEKNLVELGNTGGMPRRLPIVEYDGKKWFLDERLKQIRNIHNPHDFEDLNKDEVFVLKHKDLIMEIFQAEKDQKRKKKTGVKVED